MEDRGLFRTEALESRKIKWMGDINLAQPVSFSIISFVVLLISTLIIGFIVLGTYTKRYTVPGQLVPNTGVLKVFSPQIGVVVDRKVIEGQTVQKGEVLYVISSETQNDGANEGVQSEISRKVKLRYSLLSEELGQMQKIHGDDEKAVQEKINALLAEQANVRGQIAGQHTRVRIAEEALGRTTQLLSKGYISEEVYQQKNIDLLEQKNRLAVLDRELINIIKELAGHRAEQAALPFRQRSQVNQIERSMVSAEQELTESENKRRITIVAPQGGIATAVIAEIGQSVDSGRPVVSIIPNDAVLQAHLFAPSRAIGFIKVGAPVLLRYHAYPYQKFGHAQGKVLSVSRVALSSVEAYGFQNYSSSSGESLYRIIVTLHDQEVSVYGHQQSLQAGMLLDADILLDKRKIYEWILEPLFGLTKKL